MIIKTEMSLTDFEAWSGARSTLDRIISEDKCDELETLLELEYPDGMTDTELNDLLWFDSDTVFEWLGIRTYSQIKEELEDVKAELENLYADYESDIDDEELSAQERQAIYESDYEDNIEELKERIAELEEELAEAA